MKKICKGFSWVLVFALLAGFVPILPSLAEPLTASATNGYGSNGKFLAPIDPPVEGSIPISTRAELEAIATNSTTLGLNYHLINDIDLSGTEWVPIGLGWYDSSFSGVFDGQGYIIHNLTITGSGYDAKNGEDCAGLFSRVINGAIMNVGMESSYIDIVLTGVSTASGSVGGICGLSNDSTINNCYNSGIVISSSITENPYTVSVGGISGVSLSSNISYCYNTGDISASSLDWCSYTGGIIGNGWLDSTVNNCYNTGDITSSSPFGSPSAGGIVGYFESSTISSCFNSGVIFSISSNELYEYEDACAGGISGEVGYSAIRNCYNIGNIYSSALVHTVDTHAGGITASSGSSSISNCYNIT